MSKHNLRNQLLEIRRNISPTKRLEWSQKICQNILKFTPYLNAMNIAIYYNKAEEVDIKYLLEDTEKKQFYLPVLQDNWQLKFFTYTKESKLITNKWDILEPNPETQTQIELNKVDIIFSPLVGFDKYGNRLGMGKGCYDRSIPKNHQAILVGVGFSCQEYESIPHEAHDIKLNYVITEKNIFHFP